MFIPSHSRITSYSIFMIALSTLVLMLQINGDSTISFETLFHSLMPLIPWKLSLICDSSPFLISIPLFKVVSSSPCFFPPFNFLDASAFQIIVGSCLGHPLLLLSKLSKHSCNLSLQLSASRQLIIFVAFL